MKQLKISKEHFTARETKGFDKYLSDIKKYPRLSADEEVELAKRIKDGDKVAYDTLFTSNLRFVVSVAKQYQHQGLPLWDLIGYGNMGLEIAIPKFDHTRGFKFISYAVWWIRQKITEALNDYSKPVRIPPNRGNSNTRINQKRVELMQELEREPTDQEIMDALGMGKEEFGYSTLDKKALSLDAPLGEDGEGSLIDILDLNTERTDSALIRESLSKDLNSYMNLLSQREKDILNYYYGLNGEKPLILKDIASILRTTSERVRKQKEHAIRKLQKTTSKNNLRSYL